MDRFITDSPVEYHQSQEEQPESIQDVYFGLRSYNVQHEQCPSEFIVYFKIGTIFVRPMAIFNGNILQEFYQTFPYVHRRSVGEVDWILLPTKPETAEEILNSDYLYLIGTYSYCKDHINATIVALSPVCKVYVFGEMYRGFMFSQPSTLDLKGRIFWYNCTQLTEVPIKQNSTIEVTEGSLFVFICDYSHIVLVPDFDCQYKFKHFDDEDEKSTSNKQDDKDISVQIKESEKIMANIKMNILEKFKQEQQTVPEPNQARTKTPKEPSSLGLETCCLYPIRADSMIKKYPFKVDLGDLKRMEDQNVQKTIGTPKISGTVTKIISPSETQIVQALHSPKQTTVILDGGKGENIRVNIRIVDSGAKEDKQIQTEENQIQTKEQQIQTEENIQIKVLNVSPEVKFQPKIFESNRLNFQSPPPSQIDKTAVTSIKKTSLVIKSPPKYLSPTKSDETKKTIPVKMPVLSKKLVGKIKIKSKTIRHKKKLKMFSKQQAKSESSSSLSKKSISKSVKVKEQGKRPSSLKYRVKSLGKTLVYAGNAKRQRSRLEKISSLISSLNEQIQKMDQQTNKSILEKLSENSDSLRQTVSSIIQKGREYCRVDTNNKPSMSKTSIQSNDSVDKQQINERIKHYLNELESILHRNTWNDMDSIYSIQHFAMNLGDCLRQQFEKQRKTSTKHEKRSK